MVRTIRARLTYANVMSTIAVFGVLATGSAYAANTVFSTDIVDGEVKSADIGTGEVGSADVKDNSINTFDVHSFLGDDVVDGTLTGSDVADTSSLGPSDIHEESLAFANTLVSSDLGPGSVTADEVRDGELNDEDVAEGAFARFEGSIGVVPAQSCVSRTVTGVGAQGDHLIITPNGSNAATFLTYTAQFHPNDQNMEIKACNPTALPIDDGTNQFNLLVIDAN